MMNWGIFVWITTGILSCVVDFMDQVSISMKSNYQAIVVILKSLQLNMIPRGMHYGPGWEVEILTIVRKM